MFKTQLMLLSILSILLVSCSTDKKSDAKESIVVNLGAEPRSLDPTLNSESTTSMYLVHLFESLTKKDKNNTVVPGVAEKWDISADGKVYTFYLRDDAKWSDGVPVKANDFVYAWQRAVDPKTAASYSYMLEYIKNAKAITASEMSVDSLGVKAIDDKTLEVTLESPTPYFLEFISSLGPYYPLRQDIVEANAETWTQKPETYIGNGAYIMTKRNFDESLILNVNTNYWDKQEIVADEIIFLLMTDTTAALAGLKIDDIHFALPPINEIDVLREEGYIIDNHAYGTIYITLNMLNPKISDVHVRKALSLAIDRSYLVENIVKGGQRPAGAFVPYGIIGVNGEYRESFPEYMSVTKESNKKNIEEAKKLMAEAGYPNGKDFPVIDFRVTAGLYTLVAEAIQQMWKENLGIDIIISTEEFAITLGNLRDKNYEIARMGWTGDYNDPMTILDTHLSYGAINFSGFDNIEYDFLIDLAKSTADMEARMDALSKAENILMDEMPIIPLYYRADSIMISPNIKNYVLDPLSRHKFHYSYIEK